MRVRGGLGLQNLIELRTWRLILGVFIVAALDHVDVHSISAAAALGVIRRRDIEQKLSRRWSVDIITKLILRVFDKH